MVGWKWQMKHWSALKTGLMPAELTSRRGEKGFFGSGSMGGTFGGCCEQVSQEPSSSDTRRRLSLKRALSFVIKAWMGIGNGGRGVRPRAGILCLEPSRHGLG